MSFPRLTCELARFLPARARARDAPAPEIDLSAAMKAALKVCCYNYKGGCGKTTIHVNAAAASAEQGKKVLQIDLDPQCNTTQFWNPADDVGTMSEDSPT